MTLSDEDLCYLSAAFNEHPHTREKIDRYVRINDWLKAQIVEARERPERERRYRESIRGTHYED